MKYIIGVVVLIAVAVGGFFVLKKNSAEAKLTKPWIEVETAGVSELNPADGAFARWLETGDELDSGAVIKTETAASGIVHFPDGSNLSLDPDTKIVLKEANYDEKSETLVVKIFLEAGRIWSKVIGLATPESDWQVETANAVATVRGTAFGSVYINNETNFIGSENNVEVETKERKTGERVAGTKTTITTDDVVVINDKVQAAVGLRAAALAKEKLGNEPLKEWAARETKRNEALDNKIEKLKDEGLAPKEIRQKVREELRDKFRDRILERREILKERMENRLDAIPAGVTMPGFEIVRAQVLKALAESGRADLARQMEGLSDKEFALKLQSLWSEEWFKLLNREDLRDALLKFQQIDPSAKENLLNEINNAIDTSVTDTSGSGGTSAGTTVKPLPKSLEIKFGVDLSKPVTDGTPIAFKAILVLSDGTRKDATGEVKWQVLGPIGAIDAAGNFRAKIAPEFVEFGESSGSIVATWSNAAGDVNLLGKTPIFKVALPVDNTLLQG